MSRRTGKHLAAKIIKNAELDGHLINHGRREYEVLKKLDHVGVVCDYVLIVPSSYGVVLAECDQTTGNVHGIARVM